MYRGYEREVGYHDWQGVRAAEITSLPAVIPPRLMYTILSDCLFGQMAAEISMLSENGGLHMLFVLRADGRNRMDTAKRLDEAMDHALWELKREGFLIVRPAEAMMDALLPSSYEGGTLFHAAEQEGGYYIPADIGKVKPIDWAEISGTLGRCGNALFTVQLMPTAFSAPEKEMIRQNLHFFGENVNDADQANVGMTAYSRLKNMMDAPMFFAVTGVFGSRRARQEFSPLLARSGLVDMPLSGDRIREMDDLAMSPFMLADDLAAQGHVQAHRLTPVLQRLSHMMSKEMAAAYTALPQNASDVAGMRIHSVPRQNQPIPEKMRGPEGIFIGHTDGQNQKVYFPLDWFPLHTAIAGMPGMGKTTYAVGLLHQIYRKGYPFLIIEPTKTEYREMIDCIPELRIYTAGRTDLSPLFINPFLPPRGVTLEQYKPSLISIFVSAFSMTSPLDVIFPDVVSECYTRYGWRNSSTRDSKGITVFGLQEFICVFRESIQHSRYDSESRMNLESGGIYRLQALLNANHVLFDTERTVDFDELLEHPTLIELDAIDHAEQKALIMSIIMINLMLVVRRKQICDGRFKNVIMIDEAHMLLGQHLGQSNEEGAKAGQSLVQMLQNLSAAIRGYGTGLIFADQSPRKMTEEIVGNCNFKTLFHLENVGDQRMLAHAMGMTEEMVADVRGMNPGEAYIGCSKLPVPLRIHTPDVRNELKLRSRIDDEEIRAHRPEQEAFAQPFTGCARHGCCAEGCDYGCRIEAEFLARTICLKTADLLLQEEGVKGIVEDRDELVRSVIDSMGNYDLDRERLKACTLLHLLRRIRLTSPCNTRWVEELYRQ